ncbi:hypothetical protein MXB_4113 [Myxobolus squamalis]|nr:hypothetical protein MXB_4113 [Myxobolus squamalis]
MAKETLPKPFGKEKFIEHDISAGCNCSTGHDYVKTPILYPSTPNTPKILVCEEVGQPISSKTIDSNYGNLEKRPEFEMYDSFSYQKTKSSQKKDGKSGENLVFEIPHKASSQNAIDFTDFCHIHNHEHKKEALCEIRRNLAEVQSIILQTSHALNLACSQNKSKRFITLEIIEAERHLLLSSDMPCMCEAPNTYHYRVNLTLKEYFLLANKDFDIYYFCFIISHKQYILCTSAISITDIENNALNFPNILKIFNVDTSDCDPIMSPRSTNFTYVGEINLLASKSGIQKLALSNIIFDCPITGLLTCNLEVQQINQCHAKGFLTLFDESGKANLWRRYWCGLFRDCLSLWNYPEDELAKNPVKEIKLNWPSREENINILSQYDCARQHTFEISVVGSNSSKPKLTDIITFYFIFNIKISIFC